MTGAPVAAATFSWSAHDRAARTQLRSAASRRLCQRSGSGEAAFDISDDVIDMLDADREAHIAVRHAGRLLLFGRELRVRGRRRMDGEAARVADIGDVIEQLSASMNLRPASLPPASSKPTRPPKPPLR